MFQKLNPIVASIKIIIPVHNTAAKLQQLLLHLQQHTEVSLAHVLVVDDGSTDGTHSLLQQKFPDVLVLPGHGHLYWTGAIQKGMEAALQTDASYLFWLNHDCRPYPGSFHLLLQALQNRSVGCVSGYCHLTGNPSCPINPGFKNFCALKIPSSSTDLLSADGLNGNLVGFRTEVIRRIGLPEASRFPHYGDGPYTLKLTRAGYQALVCLQARAELDEPSERFLPLWRQVASRPQPFTSWFLHCFCSITSHHHYQYRWNQSCYFRGPLLGPLTYIITQLRALLEILWGSFYQWSSPFFLFFLKRK